MQHKNAMPAQVAGTEQIQNAASSGVPRAFFISFITSLELYTL